jgi:serine O-acetyltransferase
MNMNSADLTSTLRTNSEAQSLETVTTGSRNPWLRPFQTIAADYARHESRLSNPAFIALLTYRLGRWAIHRRNPLLRWAASKSYGFINLFVANITKIWLPPRVKIGKDFHIVHGEGSLSIHPDAVIGDRLGVMHNVTIGTNMRPGAPVIGNDVFIGVNSTVLGPIKIGDRVRIAANTAVSTNVPSDSIVVGSPAKIYRRLTPFAKSQSRAD